MISNLLVTRYFYFTILKNKFILWSQFIFLTSNNALGYTCPHTRTVPTSYLKDVSCFQPANSYLKKHAVLYRTTSVIMKRIIHHPYLTEGWFPYVTWKWMFSLLQILFSKRLQFRSKMKLTVIHNQEYKYDLIHYGQSEEAWLLITTTQHHLYIQDKWA